MNNATLVLKYLLKGCYIGICKRHILTEVRWSDEEVTNIFVITVFRTLLQA